MLSLIVLILALALDLRSPVQYDTIISDLIYLELSGCWVGFSG